MILYSMISNVSLEGLFLTGFLPGVMIIFGACVYTYFVFRKKEEIVRKPIPGPTELWAVFKECFWSLMLPVIIFGGIFSGAFTANEAAVVALLADAGHNLSDALGLGVTDVVEEPVAPPGPGRSAPAPRSA